ncbi:hypothetical protein ACLVWU_06790 [Bdellovibrio sp. HCB290]|uniref:hypothetical protein n=1 Tax=Bdellovibrio sp. HCB290 TaxID=3394356 RepID=UPI0039B66A89
MAQKNKKSVKSQSKRNSSRRSMDDDLAGREDLSRDDLETDFELTGRESLSKKNQRRSNRP